jgi:Bacterial capsule synthesis protein PGA_cap
MRTRSIAATAMAAVALTGCAITPPVQLSNPEPAAHESALSTGLSAEETAPTETAPPTGPVGASRPEITGTNPVTLSFAGDVHFEKALRPVASDPDGLAPLKGILSKADVTVVNLETAITTGGSPQPGKPYTFRAPASALMTLANAGVDVAGVANNHSADYNNDGLTDTLAARRTPR